MSTQSLSQGSTLSQQFRDARGRLFIPPLHGCMGILLAPANTGKTSLGLSGEDNLVIAFESSPTPIKDTKGILWPGRGDRGERIGLDGKTIASWEWKRIIEMRDTLIQMATSNDPNRPKTIFFDTVDEMKELLKPFAAKCLSSKEGATWRDIHGQQGWPFIYEQIAKLGLVLNQAGYGAFFVMHIGDKKVDAGVDSSGEKAFVLKEGVPLLTENFYQSLYRMCDLVLIMQKVEEDAEEVIKEAVPGGGFREKRVTRKQTVVRVSDSDLPNTKAKSRVRKLGSIVIPEKNGWAALVARYEEIRKGMLE